MRKIFTFLFLVLSSFFIIYSQNNVSSLDNVVFEGVNIELTSYKSEFKEAENNYNIVYSPFLPAGAIYSIKDIKTEKEAVIQIGTSQVNKSPYILYLPEYLFNFFSKFQTEKTEIIKLKIKFLAWNKDSVKSTHLNILSLIVNEYNSYDQVTLNGKDKYYIQIGAFTYYQNSYPIIEDMIPYLKIIPSFYIFKKELMIKDESKTIYRILAGPYSSEQEARTIANNINKKKNTNVVVHSAESVIKEYSVEK